MTSLVNNAFSRAGINSKEKFQILKQLEQVVYRRSHSQDAPNLAKEHAKPVRQELPANVLAELMRIPEQDSESGEEKHTRRKKEMSFVFTVQSREGYYAAHVRVRQSAKNSVPPCGHYNISYSQVDKNKPGPKLVEVSQTPRSDPPPQDPPQFRLPKIHRRQIRMVPFSKQSSRKPMASEFEGPHEKRFMMVNLSPKVSSKYKYELFRNASSPNLAKSIPRSGVLFVTKSLSPEYSPNKEALMKDLGRVAQFSKMPERKPIFDPKPLPEGYDVKFRIVDPAAPAADFSKPTGRNIDPWSPLPSFMHVTTSRIALETQNKKAYQMNCTNESFFTQGNTTVLGRSDVASGDVSKIVPLESKRD